LQTYVRKRDRLGRDTAKTEAEEGAGNFDDLVIAYALSLVGVGDTGVGDASNLMPVGSNSDFASSSGPMVMGNSARIASQESFAEVGGPGLLMPMALAPDEPPEMSAQRQLDAYTLALGGIPIADSKPSVVPPKYFYSRKE
jgi:hypothetical protein